MYFYFRAKKKNAEDKRERMKTGGGSPPKPEDPTSSKVFALMGNELESSNNIYDSDAVSNKYLSIFFSF